MAVLPESERTAAWKQMMESLSDRREGVSFTKTDLTAAVAAADAWVDSNAASFNAALPAAFRNRASAAQKALLLMIVLIRRYGAGV